MTVFMKLITIAGAVFLIAEVQVNAETVAYTAEPPALPSVADTTAIDSALVKTIQTKMTKDASLSELNLSISSSGGAITLGGSAMNQTQIDKAISIAQSTAGVTSVKSNMTIKPGNH